MVHHPLPPRPNTDLNTDVNSFPTETSIAAFESINPSTLLSKTAVASPRSSTPNTNCTICAQPGKYKCPGCNLSTCSVACSKSHKKRDDCSGRRNPAAYVPLKDVNQGQWGDDYKWLEEGRRRVAEWGEDLPKGGLLLLRDNQHHIRHDKRHAMAMQFKKLGIDVMFMPEGMARRVKNQSFWSPKTQTLSITIQLELCLNEMASSIGPPSPEDTTDTTSPLNTKLITHPRVCLTASGVGENELPTLASLIPSVLELSVPQTVFALPYYTSKRDALPAIASKRYFPPLDPGLPIAQTLSGTSFVEFPTIHVMTLAAWQERVTKGDIVIEQRLEMQDVQQNRQVDDGWRGKRKHAAITPAQEDGERALPDKPTPSIAPLAAKKPSQDYVPIATAALTSLVDYDSEDNESEDEAPTGLS